MENVIWYENVLPLHTDRLKKHRIQMVIINPLVTLIVVAFYVWFAVTYYDRQMSSRLVFIVIITPIAAFVIAYHIFTDILNRTPVKVSFLPEGMLLFELRGKERFVPYEDIVAVSRHPSYDDYEEYRYYVFSYKRKKHHKIPYSEVLTWDNKNRLVSILSELKKQGKWAGKIEV